MESAANRAPPTQAKPRRPPPSKRTRGVSRNMRRHEQPKRRASAAASCAGGKSRCAGGASASRHASSQSLGLRAKKRHWRQTHAARPKAYGPKCAKIVPMSSSVKARWMGASSASSCKDCWLFGRRRRRRGDECCHRRTTSTMGGVQRTSSGAPRAARARAQRCAPAPNVSRHRMRARRAWLLLHGVNPKPSLSRATDRSSYSKIEGCKSDERECLLSADQSIKPKATHVNVVRLGRLQ